MEDHFRFFGNIVDTIRKNFYEIFVNVDGIANMTNHLRSFGPKLYLKRHFMYHILWPLKSGEKNTEKGGGWAKTEMLTGFWSFTSIKIFVHTSWGRGKNVKTLRKHLNTIFIAGEAKLLNIRVMEELSCPLCNIKCNDR